MIVMDSMGCMMGVSCGTAGYDGRRDSCGGGGCGWRSVVGGEEDWKGEACGGVKGGVGVYGSESSCSCANCACSSFAVSRASVLT